MSPILCQVCGKDQEVTSESHTAFRVYKGLPYPPSISSFRTSITQSTSSIHPLTTKQPLYKLPLPTTSKQPPQPSKCSSPPPSSPSSPASPSLPLLRSLSVSFTFPAADSTALPNAVPPMSSVLPTLTAPTVSRTECVTQARSQTNTLLAPTIPTNATDFSAVCSAIGQRARCCVLPIVSNNLSWKTTRAITNGQPLVAWPGCPLRDPRRCL
jgi:hypothetical protein